MIAFAASTNQCGWKRVLETCFFHGWRGKANKLLKSLDSFIMSHEWKLTYSLLWGWNWNFPLTPFSLKRTQWDSLNLDQNSTSLLKISMSFLKSQQKVFGFLLKIFIWSTGCLFSATGCHMHKSSTWLLQGRNGNFFRGFLLQFKNLLKSWEKTSFVWATQYAVW